MSEKINHQHKQRIRISKAKSETKTARTLRQSNLLCRSLRKRSRRSAVFRALGSAILMLRAIDDDAAVATGRARRLRRQPLLYALIVESMPAALQDPDLLPSEELRQANRALCLHTGQLHLRREHHQRRRRQGRHGPFAGGILLGLALSPRRQAALRGRRRLAAEEPADGEGEGEGAEEKAEDEDDEVGLEVAGRVGGGSGPRPAAAGAACRQRRSEAEDPVYGGRGGVSRGCFHRRRSHFSPCRVIEKLSSSAFRRKEDGVVYLQGLCLTKLVLLFQNTKQAETERERVVSGNL